MNSAPIEDHRCYLPSCWNDDERMMVLFSAFRKKELNPIGWQDKMNFWVNTISEYCIKMKKAVISSNDLRVAFGKDKRYPNCIDDVLDHMYKQGFITTIEECRSRSAGWLGWSYDVVVKKPFFWGYTVVKDLIFEREQQKDIKFVVYDIARDLAEAILQKHAELVELEKVDYIVDLNHFKFQCVDICVGDNFEIALVLLQQDKRVMILAENGKHYIKFKKEDSEDINQFSECDKAILKLRKSVEILSNEIDAVDKEISSCTTEARQLVHQGFKIKAMAVLRRRKKFENDLKRKTASIDNLETMLMQLKSTSTNKQVLQAYNTGVSAMKSCLVNDLDINKIDTTMADIEEMADNLADVENVLSKGLSTNDEDLELELEEILSQDEENEVVAHDTTSIEEMEGDLMRRLQALSLPLSPNTVSPISNSSNRPKISAKTIHDESGQLYSAT